MVRSMLKGKSVPSKFWGEATVTTTYILNKCPTKKLSGMTPEEKWSGKKPSVDHFRIFGSLCYVHLLDQKRKKLDDKAQQMLLVGCHSTGGYKQYNLDTKKVVVSRDVTCIENESWKWKVVEENVRVSDDLPLIDELEDELYNELN
uniref:Copia protein n=1 Tax=Cajanus cajan TaxID=3821 RepID=A0A151SJ76_CAJCA|nr:Copia protein [Cajanus cajan]